MENWTQMLALYIEDELSSDERAQVQKQLMQNPALRAEYENYKTILASLKDLPNEDLPPGLHEKIMQNITKEQNITKQATATTIIQPKPKPKKSIMRFVLPLIFVIIPLLTVLVSLSFPCLWPGVAGFLPMGLPCHFLCG